MDIKRRKLWVAPLMLTFGVMDAQAADDKSPRIGQNCGETVIRYGPPCGIRIGPPCTPRIGTECKPRIGPACKPRFGVPCVNRIGAQCKPMPAEPLPPKQ